MSSCSMFAQAPSACRPQLHARVNGQQQKQVAAAATWRAAAIGGSAAAALASAAAVPAATAPARCPVQPCRAVAAPEAPAPVAPAAGHKQAPLKVVIAGAGIGGLVLAVGLLKRGFDVTVLERDMTAIRGEGKYRGPIQVRRDGGPGAQRERRCGTRAASQAASGRVDVKLLHAWHPCPPARLPRRGQRPGATPPPLLASRARPLAHIRAPLAAALRAPLVPSPSPGRLPYSPSHTSRSSPTRWVRWRPWTSAWRSGCTRRGASRGTASTACATA